MSEKRFKPKYPSVTYKVIDEDGNQYTVDDLCDLLNEQQATISQLEEEKGYWKSKAMTLLMQVRRLTPRMTEKEVIEFSKELEDE